jgi:predicted MFS family arabinose efflux permease
MGMIGAAFGLGFVFGPAVGGVLAAHSLSTPGFVAAALSLVNLAGAFFLLPEPAQHAAVARQRGRFEALFAELRKPGIRKLLLVFFVVTLAFSAMEATYAFLAQRHYGLDARHVGWVFAYIGVIVVLVQGGLIGPLTRRYGEKKLLVAGAVLQAVSLAALPFAVGIPGLLLATAPLALGSGLSSPSLSSLLSKSSRAEDQGGTLGIGQSASALGRILGPLSGTTSFSAWHAAPYLGGAVLMGLGAAVAATVDVPRIDDARSARAAVEPAS